VIFDEAHHVEAVATEYFSTETSLHAIRRQLNKLVSMREPKGALMRLHRAVLDHDATQLYPPTAQIMRMLGEELPGMRRDLEMVLTGHFEELFHRTLQHFNIERLFPRERRELRISDQVAATSYFSHARDLLQQVFDELSGFVRHLGKLLNLLKFYPDEIARELADARMAVASCHTKLNERAAAVAFFLKAETDQHCRWLELSIWRDRPAVRICAAPLNMAEELRKAVFAKKKTVILTSATLTVENRFDFFARLLGLQLPPDEQGEAATDQSGNLLADIEARTEFLQLGTPFDFQRNCMTGVMLDLPAPLDPQFDVAAQQPILEAIRITGGRAFVLFTSYRSLERVFNALSSELAEEGIVALRQGEMPRHRLLEVFRSTPRAALFATSSFWEGVDVQGRALECLIITRLPFHVPTTPILEARTERIDRNGGNSFRELTVPLAVIRFRQGFGRLIRSKTDRGIVLILDNRLATKDYGKVFMRSLPKTRLMTGTTADVLDSLRSFYAGDA
jgi:ATP-dependent DNA helicase DinG